MSESTAPAIIFTDDGWILSATEPPVTSADLQARVVDGYSGLGGAFGWSLGDHEVYQYETERGEIFGQGRTSFDDGLRSFVHSPTPGVMPRIAENIQALIAEDGGPMTILTRQSREAGLPFFPRVRMNSHYDMDPDHPGYGRFRRERPDLMIGRPGESIPEGTIEWGIKTGLDFTFPEVREHRLSIVEEVVERFDVDGVELDYMRHPAFFRPDEAYGSRYLMTDLVDKARRLLDEAGSSRGRRLPLAVRVPPTLYDSARIGLDVGEWIAGGLVDIVVVGGGFIPFETPIREFTAAASGTGCLVYGCIEGTVTADERSMRSLAALWSEDGAAGVYLYNFFTMPPAWNRRTARELTDSAAFQRLDRRYEIFRPRSYEGGGGHSTAFKYASPVSQLPVKLAPSQGSGEWCGPKLTLELASNEGAGKGGARLRLRLDRLPEPGERIDVELNGKLLPAGSAKTSDGWRRNVIPTTFWVEYPARVVEREEEGVSVEYDIDQGMLGPGENTVRARLASNGDRSLALDAVQIDVTGG